VFEHEELITFALSCYISLIFYTSNVALSREERISVEPIIKACGTPMFLTNDYYSWDKEYRVWVSGGKSTYLINAVHVLINLHSLDATKAKNLLRSKILDAEQVYCDLRDQYMKDCAPGPQVIRFFELLELGIAGNCLFHAKSARYDPSIPVPIRNSEKELPLNSGTSHSHARLDTPIDNTESPKTSTTAESVSTREWTTSNLQDAKPADEKERIQDEAVVRNGIEYLTDQVITPYLVVYHAKRSHQIALEPFAYTSSLPEKGARNTLIDALENYYEVPSAPLFKIREIVAAIHNVSLMYKNCPIF
jgi:ophiobolin F synthase